MSEINVSVGGGPGVVVSVAGDGTTATVTTGGTVNVTLTESNPTWGGISGKPTTFPPQAHSHAIGDVTGLAAALAQKVELDPFGKVLASQLPSSTTSTLGGVIVGAGLGVSSGTVSVTYGTTAGTACQGNDARLSDARTPAAGSVTDASITSGGLSTSSLNWAAIQPWAASTAYSKGDLVSFQGIAYRRSAAGTSGATFNIANWQQITPSEFVGSQITSGTLAFARLQARARAASNIYLWSSFR